jgi:hypothetical protein
MGNCNPWKKTEESKNFKEETVLQILIEEPAFKRFGADGLLDCGFEYRLVKRNEEEASPMTRLFHVESGVMITPNNRKQYIPDGSIFDEVGTHCQEIAQERIQNEYGLHFVTLFSHEGEPVQALVSQDYNEDSDSPVLVVIAGKGKSRAGVLSMKQLMLSGTEQGSAMFHIQQARTRGLDAILLDPNARGKGEGAVLVRSSLDHLDWSKKNVYILAHSAAGGYLVRYLLEGDKRQELRSSIRALAFTDSTHNLRWAQEDRSLHIFLQSSLVLCIRNCSENPSDTFANHKHKKAGEVHEGNRWWHHRFGDIPTVWAGTTDHSAMCWVARHVIWDFFDKRGACAPSPPLS